MKKLFLFFTLLFFAATAAQAQIIIIKPWQIMLNVAGGTNYQGFGVQGNVSVRLNKTDFGLYAGTEYAHKTIAINSDLGEFEGPLKIFMLDAGVYYSLYEKILPIPLDVRLHVGAIYAIESADNPDNSKEKSNNFGNSFSVKTNYYFSKHVSIFLQQNVYITYNSPFGSLSGITSFGVSFLF